MPACSPLPVCIHYWCPPNSVRRPVSRCPARPVSGQLAPSSGRGCPAGWCPARPASGGLVSSPSGVQRPVSARPPGRSRLVPRQPGGSDGGQLGTAGQRSRLDRVEFRVVRPRPQRRSTARGGMDAGTAVEIVWRPAGSVGRGPGPGCASAGGCTRPTRQARPPRGAPCRWRLRLGRGWLRRDVAARHRVGGHLGLGLRLLCVVVAEPDVRVDGPGRTKRVRWRGWRAAPARPSEVAGLPARRQQRCDLQEWWWARQGLNL